MSLVLGLDGGGTKTAVVVADRMGHVRHHVLGPGLDPTAGDGWEARMVGLIQPLGPVDAAVLGLPYFSEVPAISDRQTRLARSVLGRMADVVNDVGVAYEGALGGAEGVLLLSGTGSMAWARGPAGVVRCGGWGDVFGDEGSAFWIGRAALARVSRDLDGRDPAPGLTQGLLAAMGLTGAALIEWTYSQTQPRAAIAALSRHVSALAETDPDAAAIIEAAARELVALAQTAARISGQGGGFGWSFAGGVFGSPLLREKVTAALGRPPMPPRLPPVGGAVLAAARKAGWRVDDRFITTLADDLAQGATQDASAEP